MQKSEHKQLLTSYRDPVDWIRSEYSRRRSRNPQYSLRAFARHLSIGSGPLSEILLSKRTVTSKQVLRIAARLGYSEGETSQFLALVEGSKGPSTTRDTFVEISNDVFHLISDWYHFGLRELMATEGFRPNIRWIARRLGISSTEVKGAVDRLLRLQLITKFGSSWRAKGEWTTTHGVPSVAIRKFHHQSLAKSIAAIDEIPVPLRDITSIMVATDPAMLEVARKEIKKFRRKMARLLESGKKTEVYQLNIQLIPLTKKETRNEKSH